MKKKLILIILISTLSLNGCLKIGSAGHVFFLVKFKADYADNALAMNENENAHSGKVRYRVFSMHEHPIQLINGFCIHRDMYESVVVLSISREEATQGTFTSDSIASLIIDDDPIEELWLRDEQGHRRRFTVDCWDSDCCPYDTVALNEVIGSEKLNRYFERLK